MSREIELTGGLKAIVDDEDFELVNRSWHVHRNPGGRLYARTAMTWKGKTVWMHRLIAGATTDQIVDHVNGNSLDNRRCNLRIATKSQDLANQRLRSDSTSGFKGVSFQDRSGQWRAYIVAGGRQLHLGVFADRREAARTYDEAALKYFGEFARTNASMGLL